MSTANLWVVVMAMMSFMTITHWSMAESWGKTVESGHQKTTTLRFYFHDIISGKNPTAIMLDKPQGSSKYQAFGALFMADDLLTIGPDPASKLVGHAQGLYGPSSRSDLSLMVAMTYGFIDGIYNGSSISILGQNPVTHPVREIPVVGGTGLFRIARGYALAHTYWFNVTTGDAIVGYNVTIVH
ncbi:hypothetical protein Droror1_Dr00007081 [Drosera rotundifolia]